MKVQKSFLVVSLAAVGIWLLAGAVLVTPSAMAQGKEDKPIPASDKAPPGLEKLEKDKKEHPAKPGRPASVDELLDEVSKQPGGKEKVEKAKGKKPDKAVPASDKVPPGLDKLEKDKKEHPAKPGRPASVDELLDQVSKQPGGKDKVDKAKAHRKEKKGPKGGMAWLPRLNPFRADSAAAQARFSLTLNRANNWYQSTGRAYFYGALLWPGGDYWRLYSSYSSATMGFVIKKAAAYPSFNAPVTGWYVVNVQTASTSPAMSAWLYVSGTGWVKQVDFSSGVSTNHALLLYLSAGWHHVFYTVNSGSAYVTQITVQSIP